MIESPETDEDGPGVRFNPTLITAVSMLGGIAIDQLHPLPLPPDLPGTAIGAVIMCIAFALVFWSLRQYHHADTEVRPDRPDTALITGGPYRFTRNPLYIVLALVQITVAFWLNNLWILALTPVTMIIIARYAVTREERYLEKKFGQEYLEYKQQVRRWI